MHFQRFHEPSLAQFSYLIGCEQSGEAIVVDPVRDGARYRDAAAAKKLRIAFVAETHIHADFASGARDLAAECGATLLLSGEGGEAWQYAVAASAGARVLKDGDQIAVGRVRIDALHTPGHTPEHLTFVATDTARGEQPVGLLTGDFLFVGDVGRPDLLERAVGQVGTMDAAARALFASLRRLASFPDFVQLWPGHGAGSACGKSLGAVPQSTLGYERAYNWALLARDERQFVDAVLAGQPEPPGYFAATKRLNRDGVPPRRATVVRQLPTEAFSDALRGGTLIDTRHPDRFAAGHVPSAFNVPFGGSFTSWAASIAPAGRPVYLMAEPANAAQVQDAVRDLALVGVDDVAGWFDPAVMDVWKARHGALETSTQTTARAAADAIARGEVAVIDVRNPGEWEAGHIPNVTNVPLARLATELDRVRAVAGDRPVVVHCQGGVRSAIAASMLQAGGVANVTNLVGGFAAWSQAGLPVERGA